MVAFVSQGSWYSPPPGIQDKMVELRKTLLEYGVKKNLHKKLVAHTIKKEKGNPFSEEEVAEEGQDDEDDDAAA